MTSSRPQISDGAFQLKYYQKENKYIFINRKDLTILQIECRNIFKETLTKEQYALMIKLAIEESKKR